MAQNYGPRIVQNGLVLNLDAKDINSYPGSGNTWYDTSGGGRHFSLINNPTWNSDGYFSLDGTDDYMTGPNTNTFNLDQEHTLEVVIRTASLGTKTLFNWRGGSTADRQIMGHVPYLGDVVYYDVGNSTGANGRINYTANILNRLAYMTFRCRTSTTPYRQIFENNVEKVNSGANSTATMTFGAQAALIGAFNNFNIPGSGGVWHGNLYTFRLYNRALSDQELTQNYLATKSRFSL